MPPRSDLQRGLAWALAALAPFAALTLVLGFIVSPQAMAAGEPLGWLGLQATRCSGCMACGLSRGFSALSRGDLGTAVALNPGVLVAWPAAWAVALGGPLLLARVLWKRS